jgi:hypothetical protein
MVQIDSEVIGDAIVMAVPALMLGGLLGFGADVGRRAGAAVVRWIRNRRALSVNVNRLGQIGKINVRVRGVRVFKLRLQAACLIFRLGAAVAGTAIEIADDAA